MSEISAIDIRVNNLINPLGINGDAPEISWRIAGSIRQSAWRICAAGSIEAWEKGEFIWDSGKVKDASMSTHRYGGGDLQSREYVCFKVMLWDENDEPGRWSEVNSFECGLLTEADWDAQYVGFPAGWAGAAVAFQCFKNFTAKYKKLRLYVAGSCVESYFNGRKLGGNTLLQPPQSDYSKSFHYMTYDLSGMEVIGNNTLSFYVGGGWVGMVQLRYRFEGDGQLILRSHYDMVPHCSKSAITRNSIYGGEEYDATQALPEIWHDAVTCMFPEHRAAMRMNVFTGGTPRGLEEEPIAPQEEITPVAFEKIGDERYSVDFGRNFAGFCRLKIKAPRGKLIKLLFAEVRNPDKSVNQANLVGETVMDTYTAAGTGEWEIFEPHFTYHGFRYVEVTGFPGEFTAETLTGIVLRNDVRKTGEFQCSNALVNDIFQMIRRTEESNIFAVPTDCPQRTERMGWLNDMMARNESALYLFDESNVISKWLNDIAEAQDPITGEVPMTAPLYWGFDTDPVCSSFIEATLNNYRFYGKKAQMIKLYPNLRKWVDRLLSLRQDDGILYKGPIGDWVPPLKFNNGQDCAFNLTVPKELVATALTHYAIKLLIKVALVLGKSDEGKYLTGCAAEIGRAFLDKWRTAPGKLSVNCQAAYAYAVYCQIFTGQEAAIAAGKLAELFAANDYKHTTGNVGTKYLLEVLAQYGFIESAWQLIKSDDYPGWGYMIANGATTLWERWELAEGRGMNSHNHPMLGSPCGWLFRHVAGIKLHEDSCGADRFVLSPCFIKDLDFAQSSYDSRSGLVRSAWRRDGERIIWDFELPNGVCAEVKMPDGTFKEFYGGTYTLEFT